jgi:hypothetical protein
MMRAMPQLTILLLAIASLFGRLALPSAEGSPADDEMSPDIQKRIQLIDQWVALGSTPGSSAEMREANRGQQNGKLVVAYDVYVTGASSKHPYSLLQWPVTEQEPRVIMAEVFLAADGRVCGTKQSGCRPPIQLGFMPAKGEPFRLLLISKDGKTRVAAFVVPDPIVGVDQGCSVEAVRATGKFEAALIRGRGFKPNEKINYVSNSAGEIVEGTVAANAKGEASFALAPFVKSKDRGTDQVTLKSTDCAPSVTFDWGVAPAQSAAAPR